jgi:hypothetical protein
MPDLKGLLNRLVERRVEFVVVGGFAAVSHGCPLLTMDIDVCLPFSPANVLRLQAAVADLHPVHRMTPGRAALSLTEENCRGLRNLYLDTDWGQLDCLGDVMGIGSYEAVVRESVAVELEAGTCRVLGLEALIRAKDAMDRPRDREAAAHLRAIAQRLREGRRNAEG